MKKGCSSAVNAIFAIQLMLLNFITMHKATEYQCVKKDLKNKAKRVVCIHLNNDYSGAPLVLSEVIEGLRDKGYEIDLHTDGGNEKGFLSDIKGINAHYFRIRWRQDKIFWIALLFLLQFLLFFRLLVYWRKDTVFYVNTLWPFAAGVAGRLMGKKVIYHLHETSVKPLWLKRFLFRNLDKSATDVIYVSNYLKQKDPVRQTKPHVIYNALAPDFTDQLQPINKGDTFMVVMLCSLNEYKGIFEFVQLAARLSELSFELVVSATEEELNAYFKNVRFSDNMNLFPTQIDVHSFYARASLVVNLSHPDKLVETFGLTVLEAMYYGIPAIVPTHGGIGELVNDGYNGFKICVKDLDAITYTILKLYEDKQLYADLSENAKKMADKFNYSRMISKIIKVIEE